MQNVTLILLFTLLFSDVQSQIFKGSVHDQLTDSALSYAIIYISGTSVGTYADENGNFELDITRFSSLPVTVSLLGYQSVTLYEHDYNNTYKICLLPKMEELNEVTITGKKKGNRELNLRIFKREFLGETENADYCEIINEKDLRFSYRPDSNILEASCIRPLIIRNKALGYTIEYYLDRFRYARYNRVRSETGSLSETFYIGNYLFKDELLTLNESERNNVEERREKAYLGSRMHFFRSLYLGHFITKTANKILLSDNTHLYQNFTLGSKRTINPTSLVSKKDSLSGYLKLTGDLFVTYNSKNSIMKPNKDSVFIQKDGYFDPYDISFQGYMSNQRIGDLLPFEYSLK